MLLVDLGHFYPPRSASEIEAYDADDLHQGYSEHVAGEELPGENHSASYRWGAANRQRDHLGQDDGFDHLRHGYLSGCSL